jgi:Spy/CpxP family protein refolding chaperone
MRRFAMALLAGVLMIGLALPASAQYKPHSRRQQGRIKSGMRKGQLTAKEARSLRSHAAKVAAHRAQYRSSGGRLTRREREKLRRQMKVQSKRIHRQRTDRTRRR